MARQNSPRSKGLDLFSLQVDPEAQVNPKMLFELRGMNTVAPLSMLPEGTLRLVQNLVVREGAYQTRDGTSVMGTESTPPITGLADTQTADNAVHVARFRTNGVDVFRGNDWQPVLTDFRMYAASNLAKTTWGYDVLFSGGIGGIYKLRAEGVPSVTKIIGSPSNVIHLTTFNKRVIASIQGTRVQWTVNGNSDDWEGLGSGFEDLLSSPGGTVDTQTAVVPVTDETALVIRSNSVWQMNPTGNFDAPFSFNQLFPRVGSRYPGTVVAIPQGAIFLGNQAVWRVTLNGFEDIGAPIRNLLAVSGGTLRLAQASFDDKWSEYRLVLGDRVLRYSLLSGLWTEDRYPFPVRTLLYTRFSQNLTVDELTGIADALEGAADDLGLGEQSGVFLYAMGGSGRLVVRDDPERNSAVERDINAVGVPVPMDWRIESGNVYAGSPLHRTAITEIQTQYESTAEATFTFEFSTDGGSTWALLSEQIVEATTKPSINSVQRWFERDTMQLAISAANTPQMRLIGAVPMVVKGGRITDAR